jgi:hypothetical protein
MHADFKFLKSRDVTSHIFEVRTLEVQTSLMLGFLEIFCPLCAIRTQVLSFERSCSLLDA